MGINARYSDAKTELTERITRNRDDHDINLRHQVRLGLVSVMDYLTKHKGYRSEHARVLEPQFARAIFGTYSV